VAGKSGVAAELEERLLRVADSEATVLLVGESGSGKSRAAARLHALGPRAAAPRVETQVSALASGILEAELFGHEAGAYTGADRARPGRFRRAEGGTLVLDGVEDLAPEVQVKLLRVLQEREIEPLGGDLVAVDVRVVATTSVDLQAAVERGEFREDLYYRLAVVQLEVPPLRRRLEDLPLLVESLAQGVAERARVAARPFGPEALERLARHPWPGNLRELENCVERVLVLGAAREGAVASGELDFLGDPGESGALRLARRALEEGLAIEELSGAMIEVAMEEAEGNLSAAARRVGLTRRALEYRWRRRESGEEGEPSS